MRESSLIQPLIERLDAVVSTLAGLENRFSVLTAKVDELAVTPFPVYISEEKAKRKKRGPSAPSNVGLPRGPSAPSTEVSLVGSSGPSNGTCGCES